jgi:pimeloyl-ACP methyl ester carboxylesterase
LSSAFSFLTFASSISTSVSGRRRGRGDSTDTAPYTPEREVEDVEALINEVGGPVYLYSHPSGAAIALQAAIKLRKQVRKLAIYEAPYALNSDAREAAKEYNRQLKNLLISGRNSDAVALFIRSVGVSDKQIQAMERMPMWKGLVAIAPTLAYDNDVLGEDHSLPTARLATITIPTLVAHGGAGSPSMRDTAQALSKAIPHAQLRTLAGETHGVRPKVLAPILEEFFQ